MEERDKPRLRWALPPFLAVLLGLAACALPPPSAAPGPPPAAAVAPPQHLPPGARPDLSPQWIDPTGSLHWPPNGGFAGPPVAIVLPPGMLIDRFGAPTGHFLSPKGAAFKARALPYVCEGQVYTAYQIERPLFVWSGTAAAWFDEPGGATQFETDAPVALLLADHVIQAVPRPGPAPCDKP
jgi:hypothetical protein